MSKSYKTLLFDFQPFSFKSGVCVIFNIQILTFSHILLILYSDQFIFCLNSGVNGVKIVHIVLKAWFLVWSFLRSGGKVWFWAQAKLMHLTSQWRHNDVKFFVDDVIMTSYNVIFACAPNQNLFLGLRNFHTKIHAFSSMCKILLLFITISLHYQYVQL